MWTFTTSLRWNGGATGLAGCAGKPDLVVSPPPDFGGQPDCWTPEDLMVSAIETCLMMTTLNVAQRQKLALKGYASQATGTMEKTANGLRFSRVEVAIQLQVADPASLDKAVQLVATAEKYCPVSNAVTFPVKVTASAQV